MILFAEHDLNMEIDRLARLSSEQKRLLTELGCNSSSKVIFTHLTFLKYINDDTIYFQTSPSQFLSTIPEEPTNSDAKSLRSTSVRSTTRTKSTTTKMKHKKSLHSESNVIPMKLPKSNKKQVIQDDIQIESKDKYCKGCTNVYKELLDRECALRETQISQSMESLRKEKDYYLNEYVKLMDQIKSSTTCAVPNEVIDSLKKDKEYYMVQCQKLQEQKENIEREFKEVYTKRGDSHEGSSNELLEALQKEKDYYMKAYYDVLEKLKEAGKYVSS